MVDESLSVGSVEPMSSQSSMESLSSSQSQEEEEQFSQHIVDHNSSSVMTKKAKIIGQNQEIGLNYETLKAAEELLRMH